MINDCGALRAVVIDPISPFRAIDGFPSSLWRCDPSEICTCSANRLVKNHNPMHPAYYCSRLQSWHASILNLLLNPTEGSRFRKMSDDRLAVFIWLHMIRYADLFDPNGKSWQVPARWLHVEEELIHRYTSSDVINSLKLRGSQGMCIFCLQDRMNIPIVKLQE